MAKPDKPQASQRKPAYERKNSSGQEAHKAMRREANTAKGPQRFNQDTNQFER